MISRVFMGILGSVETTKATPNKQGGFFYAYANSKTAIMATVWAISCGC